jgi:hypothetical protein
MPQAGVVYEHHHPFRLDELITTIMKTPLREQYAQFKRIFTG